MIALIVTPEGFPPAYEVMPGNTSDKTTLSDFPSKIEEQYGKFDRVWVMDRGIPTEETLGKMRSSKTPIHFLRIYFPLNFFLETPQADSLLSSRLQI